MQKVPHHHWHCNSVLSVHLHLLQVEILPSIQKLLDELSLGIIEHLIVIENL